ncbi:CCDC90 family protein [Patescibacteria group bacterium]|nr:CCDC90 family protein [Patescibacteria group bacterium]
MTKDDKQFFRGLIGDLRVELKKDISSLRTEFREDMGTFRDELRGEMNGMRTELRGEMNGMRTELKGEMNGMRTELKGEMNGMRGDIRANGVLIENLDTALCGVAEGVSDINRRMKNVEADVSDIKNTIHDYPTIRKMVQRHEKQLAKTN